MSHLEAGLTALAECYGLDAKALLVEAHRAPYAKTAWPQGTGKPGERAALFALVRVLQPDLVIECGTNWGCSTTQFLSAMRENKRGRVQSIDVRNRTEGRPIGSRIPQGLKDRWKLHVGDAAAWLTSDDTPLEFVYEDTDHQTDTVRRICEAARERLAPRGWLIVHDVILPSVKEGIRQAGLEMPFFYFDEDGRGLGIWRKPAIRLPDFDTSVERTAPGWAEFVEQAASDSAADPEALPTVERINYPDMTNAELRAEIQRRGLSAPSKANKDRLIEILMKGGLDA